MDADTREPIEGAIVWCSWAFVRGIGNQGPEAARVQETTTDADGQYRIPSLSRFPTGLSTQLARFSMVVYKKGYVAYRHDSVFDQKRRRRVFSQFFNKVRLSRWSPELSHARHLAFIGSGKSLMQASEWEVAEASAEVAGQKKKHPLMRQGLQRGIREKRKMDASVLISSDDVRAVTGYTGQFEEGRLAEKSSKTHDTYHLRAVDKPERYDVAIRLWRLSGPRLESRYEKILNSLPGSKQTDEVSDRSFIVQQGEILGIGFMNRTASALVLLTCGRGQCPQDKLIQQLAKRAHKKLSQLPPPSGDDDGSLLLDPPKPQD